MDLSTYDVTDYPQLAVGDWLDLLGPLHGPDEVAVEAGTNGYEVLTALGARYQRVFCGA
jgi:alanine racemase